MRRSIQLFTVLGCALALGACTDFASNNVCLPGAVDCRPDGGNFQTPNLNGPNPNFPDPNNAPPSQFERNDEMMVVHSIVIHEVLLDPTGPNAGNQAIELRNVTNAAMDLGDWVLSAAGQTFVMPEGLSIPATGVVAVHVGSDQDTTAINEISAPDMSELSVESGDLALISPTGEMADYLQWGEGNHDRESAAVLEGRWTTGESITVPVEGQSIMRVNGKGTADSYVGDFPTIGILGGLNLKDGGAE